MKYIPALLTGSLGSQRHEGALSAPLGSSALPAGLWMSQNTLAHGLAEILSIASRAKMTQGTLAHGVAGVAMSCQSRRPSGIPHSCIRNMWSTCSAVTSHLEKEMHYFKNIILIITKLKINKAFKDIYGKG